MYREHVGRVYYGRIESDGYLLVSYDRFSDGSETFSYKDFGGARWYDFEPSEIEKQAARRLLREGVLEGAVVNLDELLSSCRAVA